MPRLLITLLIFVAGALAGFVLLVLVGMIMAAPYQHTQPGLGAVAGGLSEVSVLLVPILSGVIAVLLKDRSRRRRQEGLTSSGK